MARRRKIALRYEYNENWIGGTYYIQNIISALNILPDHKRPALIIFTEREEDINHLKAITKYPYLQYRTYLKKLNLLERAINKIARLTIKENLISFFNTANLDVVFPGGREAVFKKVQLFLYWIPDFQEHYFPGFFSGEEIEKRKAEQKKIAVNANYIVFSSRSAKDDFNSFYPQNKVKQFVLPFAVTHPSLNFVPGSLIEKYNLPAQYFLCSNQFWKHKNHLVIFRAVALLKRKGTEVMVVFTGKESDWRNPEYFESIKETVSELKIESNVFFLGFISREDQLSLMKTSLAVIQPSLFEGWSTVIEDAKSLNIALLASNINVHKEQLEDYPSKYFFHPGSEEELSQCILEVKDGVEEFSYNYEKDVINFGELFIQIMDDVTHNINTIQAAKI